MSSLKRMVFGSAMAAVVALCACSSVDLPTPKTFKERAAVGYVTVTAVRNTAATLIVNGKLTSSEGRDVYKQTEVARATLDTAVEVYPKDAVEGETRLTRATQILQTIQSILQARSTQK